MGTCRQSRMNIKPLPKKVKVSLSGTKENTEKFISRKAVIKRMWEYLILLAVKLLTYELNISTYLDLQLAIVTRFVHWWLPWVNKIFF